MPSRSSLDLLTMFKAASRSLKQNKEALNQADDYNHNHGDNMVSIFRVITKAMETKKDASAADQLEYASQLLRQNPTSGSAVAYSEGLERAAEKFQGKQVTPDSAVELISALMGADSGQAQSNSPAGDLLGTLLGGSGSTSQSGSSGDMLGSLIGGLMGGGASSQQSSGGIDTGDLINIGMQLFQAYQASSGKPSSQSGGGLAGGLLNTLLSNSSMGSSSHRSESGKLVVDALLKIASQYLSKR
ncbi:MAG: hypothetical protein A2X24_05845 [Chloroflexi bacterium GWB2_54_36]|nr:MAG: hypothetical protein A2X24_05845 [Chloroflexi bacterium GWB2_54_36]